MSNIGLFKLNSVTEKLQADNWPLPNYSKATRLSHHYGWFGGGCTTDSGYGAKLLTVRKADFSNDLTTANSSHLINSRYSGSGSESLTNGYVFVGSGGGGTVESFSFANEGSSAKAIGTACSSADHSNAYNNSNEYTWTRVGLSDGFCFSNYTRFEHNIDFLTTSVRAAGPTCSYRQSGNVNDYCNYGWFAGGNCATPTSAYFSTIQRLDYNNDLTNVSNRGKLSVARAHSAGFDDGCTYGWWASGFSGCCTTACTILDRMEFSNDLVTASQRAALGNDFCTQAMKSDRAAYIACFGTKSIKIEYNNDLTTSLHTFDNSLMGATYCLGWAI